MDCKNSGRGCILLKPNPALCSRLGTGRSRLLRAKSRAVCDLPLEVRVAATAPHETGVLEVAPAVTSQGEPAITSAAYRRDFGSDPKFRRYAGGWLMFLRPTHRLKDCGFRRKAVVGHRSANW